MKAGPQQAERLHRFAHDIRNRLIGLQQVIVQMRQDPPESERDELVHFGEQQYFKALREVETLLDEMGVERGMPDPEMAPVALLPLINEHLELMHHRFLRKRQPLELDLAENISVMGDARILGDILDALFSNASKFSDDGSPIAITAHVADGNAVLEVRDIGTGLSADDLEQVFVRFALLSNRPTAGEAQGRGTLSRAKDRAIAHRGSLVAQSEGVGQGCTFTLRLPLLEVQ